MSGQNSGDRSWIQIAAKTESDGIVDGTLTVEFGRNGLPTTAFVIHTLNQDGGRPALNTEIQTKVDAARIVVKVVGAGNYVPFSFKGITEVATDAELRSATEGLVYFSDDQGDLYLNTDIASGWSPIELTPGAPLQTAFATNTVAYGTSIEAENFDIGMDGIAYHDSDQANSLGSFRSDTGVDVLPTKVGDIADGEWLEYTTEIVAAAYAVSVDVSSTAAGGQIRILGAKSNSAGFLKELGSVDVPDTGGDLSTVSLGVIDLASIAGPDSVIRLQFVGDFLESGLEVDSVQFDAPNQSAYIDRTDLAIKTDSATRIKLKDFDEGGQGVAYNDKTPTNDGQGEVVFRSDQGVDSNGDILTNTIENGEWLEYTTHIEGGVYDITLRKAWGGDNKAVKLSIGETNFTSDFTELGEFVLNGEEEFFTLEDIDLRPWDGPNRVLRVEIVGDSFGIDRLDFVPQTDTAAVNDSFMVAEDGILNQSAAGLLGNDIVGLNGPLAVNTTPVVVPLSGVVSLQANGAFVYTPNENFVGTDTFTYEVSDGVTTDTAAVTIEVTERLEVDLIQIGGASLVQAPPIGRSIIDVVKVQFAGLISAEPGAFVVERTDGASVAEVSVDLSLDNSSGGTVAELRFASDTVSVNSFGSLADGAYRLRIDGSKLRDADNALLGGTLMHTDGFFAKFADMDSSGSVGLSDFATFRSAFGTNEVDLNFVDGLDANRDGQIGLADFAAFRAVFGS